MKLHESHAIVTGASSGIGRAAAIELARRGADVALAARREAELLQTAEECRRFGVRAVTIPTDVTREEECRAMVERATRELGPIDLLVSNAGFAVFDRIGDASVADARAMMDTNYFGALHCARAVLPQMMERRRGAIVFVGSISGIMGYAGMGGYCASKFALTGLAEALRNEVIGHGIRVSLVCPGTTSTDFFVTAEKGKMPQASRLVLAITPERVARAIAQAASRGSYRIVVPFTASAYMKLKELFPRTAHLLMRQVSALFLRKSA
jgi:short-subunit dehydrogenase